MKADTSGAELSALIGVCTYEEAANIEALLVGLRGSLPHADVVVIDDDSPDGTAAIAQRLADADADAAIRVLVRRDQRGLGSAIVMAAGEAIAGDYDFFLNLDGDLSHDPQDLPRLLTSITADPEIDVVVGSRYAPGGKIVGWPQRRRWMSWLVNRFAVLCLRLPVRDCSGSIRCYRVSALSPCRSQSATLPRLRIAGRIVGASEPAREQDGGGPDYFHRPAKRRK